MTAASSPIPTPADVYAPLGALRNNIGATAAGETAGGRFNVWGNSFGAQHLPRAGTVEVAGVGFEFPEVGSGKPDNVRCEGQYVAVPPGRYDWIHLLAAAERRAEDELALHFAAGHVDFEPLRISDFWNAPPAFGEHEAFESPDMHYPHHVQRNVSAMLWEQRVPVTRRAVLTGVRLPRNVAVHVFALTLRGVPER